MPTVQQVILNLISGIDDTEVRMEIARTLMYLSYVYASGRADEREVAQSVYEVVETVVKMKHPELDPDERRRIAKQLAEEVMDAFRAQAIMRRVAARFGA